MRSIGFPYSRHSPINNNTSSYYSYNATADDGVPKRHRNDLASYGRGVVKLLVDCSGARLLKLTERVVIFLAYNYTRAGPLLCIFDISFLCVCVVCIFFPFILDVKFVGCISRGLT